MFKSYFKAIVLLSVIFYYSASFAADSHINLIAVGSYNTSLLEHRYPFIISSSDQGQTWSYFNNKPDELIRNADLLSTSCNGDNCVAIGYYNYVEITDNLYPAVAITHDSGKSWAYVPLQSSGLHKKTFPANVSCNHGVCAMAGSDKSSSRMSSMLAISKDNGSTWVYPVIKNLPWDYNLYESTLNKVDCSTGNCIAIGAYRKPFIVVGTNLGNDWSYYKIPFPIEPLNAKLSSIKCNDSICVIGGYDNNNLFLLKSSNKGKTWSFIQLPNVKGGFNNIECLGNECLASGWFYIKNEKYHIAVSHDSGLTWTYPKIQPPKGEGILSLVSINDNNYLVAGYDYLDFARPILIMSKDRGESWHYVNSITPKDLMGGRISNISCQKNLCLAVGNYNKDPFQVEPTTCTTCPYLMISYNSGEDWVFPSDVISKLPKDYSSNGYLRHSFSASNTQI